MILKAQLLAKKRRSGAAAIRRIGILRASPLKNKNAARFITRTAFICNASHSNNSPGYTSPTRLPSHCGYFVPRSNDYLLASSPYYSRPLLIFKLFTLSEKVPAGALALGFHPQGSFCARSSGFDLLVNFLLNCTLEL